jgi:murein L,D-transpeptidase YafK
MENAKDIKIIMFKKILNLSVSILVIAIFFFLLYPQDAFAKNYKADKVVVIKSKRVMMLLKDGEVMKIYRVALGKNPDGHKVQEGDKRTPEGNYFIVSRNQQSKYYLALNISYPNELDIQNAKKLGVSAGNNIAIHGLPKDLEDLGKFHRRMDWTDGCIAVTNREMEEIWNLVPDGVPIEIKP